MKLPVIQNSIVAEEFSFQSLSNYVAPIYLDNNASTKISDEAADAILKALEVNYANPSGAHRAGQEVKQQIEQARTHVSNFLGCLPEEIVFNSGGTEGITSVFNSVLRTHYPRRHLISCLTEHGAVLNNLKAIEEKVGYNVSYLDVDRGGKFDIEQLKSFFRKNDKVPLVSLMAANNETGTIHHNIFEAIEIAHHYGALFHIDAVQIAGKIPIKPYIDAGTDFLTISGHKLHAPKGIGALFVKKGTDYYPMILGGYQENNRRAGTENVPGIIALGIVAEKNPASAELLGPLHKKFADLLLDKLPSCIINGGGIPGTINVGFKYVHREAMVVKMSEYDLYASFGSACAKGIEPSHVLKAMKIPNEYIHGSVRFSMSKYTTENEVERAIEIIIRAYNEIRAISMGIVG
jgi:cysteine desulfurase